jgi:hypothetical protein
MQNHLVLQEEIMSGTKQRANTHLTPAQTDAINRFIDMIIWEEIAADMRKAEADCVQRGWLDDYRDGGTLEITEAGKRKFFEYLATTEARH